MVLPEKHEGKVKFITRLTDVGGCLCCLKINTFLAFGYRQLFHTFLPLIYMLPNEVAFQMTLYEASTVAVGMNFIYKDHLKLAFDIFDISST